MELLAIPLLYIAAIYGSLGAIFAIVFVIKGVTVVDEAAAGAGVWFRIIIIPGTMVFWPLLLNKWIRQKRIRVNRDPGKKEKQND